MIEFEKLSNCSSTPKSSEKGLAVVVVVEGQRDWNVTDGYSVDAAVVAVGTIVVAVARND